MGKTITISTEKPLIIMSVEEYGSMKETLEVLSDRDIMQQIRESEEAKLKGEKPIDFGELRSKQ